MNRNYKKNVRIIIIVLMAFFMTVPLFFQLKINSFKEICSFLGVPSNKELLQNYFFKILVLIGDFLMSFKGQSILFLIVFSVFIFVVIKYFKIIDKRLTCCSLVPSLLFAFFEVFGYSFAKTDSWNLIFENYRTVLKGFFLFGCFVVFFVVLISLLFYFLKSLKFTNDLSLNEKDWFTNNKKSIFIVMLLILLFWSPSLLANFPGITNYDFFDMLNSFYGNETYSLRAVTLIDPSVTLNNNNPVLQTLLAVGCVKIGTLLGMPWFGLFLFCYSQALIFALILSYVIYYLAKIGVHKNLRWCLLIFFGILPVNSNYAVTTLKDVNFAFMFIIYIIYLIDMYRNTEEFFASKRKLISFSLVNLLLMLLRNNGSYILIPTDIFLLIHYKKYWKKAITPMMLPVFIFIVVISNIIYPAFKIAPGSKREMFSVPFQQTARLVKEHGDEIPLEDRIIIDKILDYDSIAKRYQPELSDKVKATYKKDCTSEELNDYFQIWFKWLCKYPDVYIQATMNNCYGYFYPEAQSWISYTEITPPGKEYGLRSPKELATFRKAVNLIPEVVRDIPVFGMIESIGFYSWLLILSMAFLIYINSKKFLIVFTPLIVLLLTCMLSPANTMFRYIYPMILCVPILICYILHMQNEKEMY